MAVKRRRVLFLEPFYGGSHRAFADGWVAHSRHAIDLVTLPARFWKWRMRGAALHFARTVADPGSYDALVVTDLMSLSDLRALWGPACPPALVYFHENQLSYPLPPGESIDYQFGFTDITTGLAAQRVLFNSNTQFEAFFEHLPRFIGMRPEFRPRWAVEAIRKRAGVLHPGCSFPAGPPDLQPREAGEAPLIVWNHRWEFDKRPEEFFAALEAVAQRGGRFRLALLGENFQVVPKEFLRARERHGASLVQYGYLEDREAYLDWLRRGSVVVSTADQENFGMSVVEAVRHGCHPLLPNRLSYPELIDRRFHAECLYDSREDLVRRLAALLERPDVIDSRRRELAASMERFSWERVIERFDAELERLAAGGGAAAPEA